MQTRKVILIGNNNKNTLGKARSFGEAGYLPIVIWIGPRYNLVRHSKYVVESHTFDTPEEGIEFILNNYADSKDKALLSAEGDGIVAAIDLCYDQLSESFFFYNAGRKGRLSYYLQKKNLCAAAEQCGFRIPRTEEVKVGDLPRTLSYPIFTKASDSYDIGWKSSAHICYSSEDLLNAYKRMSSKSVLLQEYINKKNEYMLEGLSLNGGKEVYLPIQGFFYRLPNDAYGSFGYFEEYQGGKELLDNLKRLLQTVGYSGIFEVEFILSEQNQLYFLEINFRDTMWNHAFTQMGINLNEIWAKSMMSGRLCNDNVSIISSPHVFLNEFTDYSRYVKTHKIRLFEWLKDVKKTQSFMVWDKDDQGPFWQYIILVLLRGLERIGVGRKGSHKV